MTSKNPIFKTLWSRINERGDFPTLQRNISSIVSAMHNEEANTSQLVSVVLSDFTPDPAGDSTRQFSHVCSFWRQCDDCDARIVRAGRRRHWTPALGLQLLENFSGLAETREAAGSELHRVPVASEFARKITISKGPEGGGRSRCVHFAAESCATSCGLLLPRGVGRDSKLSATEGMAISAACEQVLGVSLEELGEEVTRRWSYPGDRSKYPAQAA